MRKDKTNKIKTTTLSCSDYLRRSQHFHARALIIQVKQYKSLNRINYVRLSSSLVAVINLLLSLITVTREDLLLS